jgi:hypothetical protein
MEEEAGLAGPITKFLAIEFATALAMSLPQPGGPYSSILGRHEFMLFKEIWINGNSTVPNPSI